MPVKAVIFDFDGLILDTETAEYRAWSDLYKSHGVELDIKQWAANIGGYDFETFDPYKYLMDNTEADLNYETLRSEIIDSHLKHVHAEEIRGGIKEAMLHAQETNLKVALASSSEQDWVIPHLQRLELLPHFSALCCGDMVKQLKPLPDLYIMALDTLELDSSEAFAVEDSEKGVAAAKAAGLYCVAVPNDVSRHLDLSAADLILDSFADIAFAELVNKIESTM